VVGAAVVGDGAVGDAVVGAVVGDVDVGKIVRHSVLDVVVHDDDALYSAEHTVHADTHAIDNWCEENATGAGCLASGALVCGPRGTNCMSIARPRASESDHSPNCAVKSSLKSHIRATDKRTR
jgi:hypothetical protein